MNVFQLKNLRFTFIILVMEAENLENLENILKIMQINFENKQKIIIILKKLIEVIEKTFMMNNSKLKYF